MALNNIKDNARNSSLQEFMGSMFKNADNAPAFTNLYSVHFATPPVINKTVNGDTFKPETGDLSLLLDYYAKNVNLPSKQITTAQFQPPGSSVKYATGASFSQISMTFMMPRSQLTRSFFERWMSLTAPDANQYTDFYNDYTCPHVRIFKFERGGGDVAASDPKMMRSLRTGGIEVVDQSRFRRNKITACWELYNVYPYNIGSVQLDNSQAKTMDLNIQFYYERYRFYPEDQFNDAGSGSQITLPAIGDNNTDGETERNRTIDINRNTGSGRDGSFGEGTYGSGRPSG